MQKNKTLLKLMVKVGQNASSGTGFYPRTQFQGAAKQQRVLSPKINKFFQECEPEPLLSIVCLYTVSILTAANLIFIYSMNFNIYGSIFTKAT